MENSFLKKLEEAKGFEDMGKMAVLVYRGAFEESQSAPLAHEATSAFFRGMFLASKEEEDGSSN